MPITYSLVVGIGGQSFADAGTFYGMDHPPFARALRDAMVTGAATIQTRIGGTPTLAAGHLHSRLDLASNGSSALEKFKGSVGNYWVENDGVTPGPLLVSFVNTITALAADARPKILRWSQGQQDASVIANFSDVALFKTAVQTIWQALRTACNAGSPTTIPFFVDMLGIRYEPDWPYEHWIRDALIDLIAAGTNVFRGAETYAARMDTTMHPSNDARGYGQIGAHAGRIVSSWGLTGAVPASPTIGAVTRLANVVTVPITTPGTLIKPGQPDWFGLFDGAGAQIPIVNYVWSGNSLLLTAAAQPASLRYPVATRRVTDPSRIIRLNAPAAPLVTDEIGLPLASTKAIAV